MDGWMDSTAAAAAAAAASAAAAAATSERYFQVVPPPVSTPTASTHPRAVRVISATGISSMTK